MSSGNAEYEITPSIAANSDDANYAANPDRKAPLASLQSIDIGGGVRRCPTICIGTNGHTTGKLANKLRADRGTVYDIIKNSINQYPERPCLGWRVKEGSPFQFMTFRQFGKRLHDAAAGLRKLGVAPGDHVGIYSKNRVAWQIASEACHTQRMVSISLYDSLGENSSLYIINHGEIHTIFCSDEVIEKVLAILPQCVPVLKNLITFDPYTAAQGQRARECNVNIMTMDELEALGASNPVEDVPPTPDTLSTIMYTSGTTGNPKGVMITHRNIVAAMTGISHILYQIGSQDRFLSYLPLAHILARVAESVILGNGACIGYWQGDIKLLKSDIQAMQPTLLAGVPRVFDKFYDAIKSAATDPTQSSWLKRFMFSRAFASKRSSRDTGAATPIWDYLVFSKLRAVVGGSVKLMLTGGAPLRPEVQEFLSIAFDCPVIQGYGLTETTAGLTVQLSDDRQTGRVGAPIPSCEVKLVDVPEMNYLTRADPPRGEVCVRGPNVALGYYKEPEKTREVFEDDGWFHTGDVGQWNADGSLSIIDRKKNIFKLAQGEYIAVEALELKLAKTPYITGVWIYGESTKNSLVAFCVVEPVSFVALAKEKGINGASEDRLEELVKNPTLTKVVLDALTATAHENKFRGFEFVKSLTLLHKSFDLFEGCCTPSYKLIRNICRDTFRADIDRMYKSLGE